MILLGNFFLNEFCVVCVQSANGSMPNTYWAMVYIVRCGRAVSHFHNDHAKREIILYAYIERSERENTTRTSRTKSTDDVFFAPSGGQC